MKINKNFEQLLNTPGVKFTFILGSGFHCNAIGGDSILSSWEKLLKELSPAAKLTGEYHLDFEKIIQSKKSTCEDSYETEKRLIKCVQKLIKEEQEKVLNECSHCYPLGIFNPEKVSDVISLNFDEVPEKLLNKDKGAKIGKYSNDSSFSSSSKKSYRYLTTRSKVLNFGEKDNITFWHPHGIVSNQGIILGAHRYANMLKTVISIRNHHMDRKRSKNENNTWYNSLLENPVLILGAGISSTEWDMWFALASRERANGLKPQIFQMRECECKKGVQQEWFEPLFMGIDFKGQWKELEKRLKPK
jgi:hypothetical protein